MFPALLVLGPVVVALDWFGAAGELTIFLLAAAALIPLAWLIGEATDSAAYYTGPGVGGFLNATFGNAPELIIALVAVSDGLTEVVRAYPLMPALLRSAGNGRRRESGHSLTGQPRIERAAGPNP